MSEVEEYRPNAKLLGTENAFKLAVFAFNVSRATSLTSAEGTIEVTWPETVHIAQTAERLNFDAVIPVSRWKGFGGVNNQNGRSFETLSWAAGIAAITKSIQVFATVHVPTIHPVRLAKEVATIDHISNGRFGLNVVAGWHDKEIELFGTTVGDHSRRYALSDEWMRLVKRIWAETEFDFNGEFFQVPGAQSEPKPLQRPYPVLMSAGSSPAGRDFAARHTDLIFIMFDDFEKAAQTVSEIKSTAREKYGREVKVMTMATIACADTEQEARDYFEYCVTEKGDWETVARILGTLDRNSQSVNYKASSVARQYIAGYGAVPLIGNPTQVVEGFQRLAATGLDGVTVTWVDFKRGLEVYENKLLPILRDTGLRA
ncbi:alkanesulfonate monooxygenase SsuD/methylene tetrahydromethanopterin reductase-like flavin-dependent oxidoreductase (luciferase family) [Rhodoligotrophos appendicifer]|uniref:LLM class flavin-dependent oxidoreductase n=1 Tax=Rhodoligotrophos appendicifer TaxID=987056 RepID=UPI0014793E09|nr:LLM class flavin-dependent oxidoreductase [Rhodoligotrophos appendicifer]